MSVIGLLALGANLLSVFLLVPYKDGDYVVHVDYGVGIFRGLVRLESGGVEREYLHVDYAKGDRLFVPVDQTDRVARYSGGGIDPTLTRLGSGEWQQTRRRVRRARAME